MFAGFLQQARCPESLVCSGLQAAEQPVLLALHARASYYIFFYKKRVATKMQRHYQARRAGPVNWEKATVFGHSLAFLMALPGLRGWTMRRGARVQRAQTRWMFFWGLPLPAGRGRYATGLAVRSAPRPTGVGSGLRPPLRSARPMPGLKPEKHKRTRHFGLRPFQPFKAPSLSLF